MIPRSRKPGPAARWMTALFIIVFAAAALILFFQQLQGKKYSGPVEKLTIGVARNIVSSLVFIAQSKDLFKAHGLDVTFKEHSAGILAMDDLLADRIDVATCADVVFVIKSSSREDLRIFASIARAEDHKIIGRRAAGISEPRDLIGKRIAVTRNTSSHFFLETFLSLNEIRLESIDLVYLQPPEMLKAIIPGKVDAVCTWEPYASRIIERLGPAAIVWPAQKGRNYNWILVAKEGFLNRRRVAVERLLKALLEAERITMEDPAEAQRIAGRYIHVSPSLVARLWDEYDLRVRLDQDLLVLMEDETRWAMRRGIIEERKMPDYFLFINLKGLEKIKPEAVGIIH